MAESRQSAGKQAGGSPATTGSTAAYGTAESDRAAAHPVESTEPLESLDLPGHGESPGLMRNTMLRPACPDPNSGSVRWPALLVSLRNPDFRLFWGGNFLSNIGTWMQNVAQGWLVLTLTNSAFWLGVIGFVGSIPFLFFTLFGGVIADRVDKRRLLIVTQTAMMLLAFVLAIFTGLHRITVWGVALLAFLNGTAMAMNAPSYQALVPRLVCAEDLTNAIALNSAQFNLSRILGPTLGGYAMALVGVAGNFYLNAVSFLAVLAALVRIRYPLEQRTRHESLLRSLAAGLSYVRALPQMYVLIWLVSIYSFFTIPFLNFIPFFARNQLHTDETGFGLLIACSGFGALLGACLVAWRGNLRHRGRIITFCSITVMLIIVVICFSHTMWISRLCLFFEGFLMILTISSVNVAMQQLSSDEMRGRVMSIYATAFLGLPPIGSLIAGELSRHIPTSMALAAMSATAASLFALIYVISPALRGLD